MATMKRKIHITLVGGQPAPVYTGIVAVQPDKVIYVYSEKTKRQLNAVKSEFSLQSEEIFLSPTDCVVILATAARLAEQYADDEITLNISGGTKAWSHFFGVVFDRLENATVIYVDQNNVIWNYKSMTSAPGPEFDMRTLFRLYGNPLEHYTDYNSYSVDDAAAISKIEAIRAFNHNDFRDLTSLLDSSMSNRLKQRKYDTFSLKSGSYVEWEKSTPQQVGFVRIVLYNKRGLTKEFSHESEHITDLVFNTSWFEYKIASILSRWKHAKEICLNCRFPDKKNVDKNEVDIVINTGSKILFVECKTQISKPTDIDKFGSVVKNYGGTGSKGIFITDSPMSDTAIKKCEDNHILHYSLRDKKSMPSKDINTLYELLNSELFNINA